MLHHTRVGDLIGVAGKSAGTVPRRTTTVGLPDDVMDMALRRLAIMSLVAGVFFGLSVIGNVTLYALGYDVPLPPIAVGARVLGLAEGVAMFFIVRNARLSRQLRLDLGLGFEVLGALVVGTAEITIAGDMGLPMGMLSAVSIWILVFRFIIPSTPGRAALASLLAAAMVPLAIWLAEKSGSGLVYPEVEPFLNKSTFATAAIAWVASRVIYSMGTAVTKARQMGSYRLVELLGQGGMGEVWRASHRFLKRPAAVKLVQAARLAPEGTDARERTLQRFEREAQATAGLSSPHTDATSTTSALPTTALSTM